MFRAPVILSNSCTYADALHIMYVHEVAYGVFAAEESNRSRNATFEITIYTLYRGAVESHSRPSNSSLLACTLSSQAKGHRAAGTCWANGRAPNVRSGPGSFIP